MMFRTTQTTILIQQAAIKTMYPITAIIQTMIAKVKYPVPIQMEETNKTMPKPNRKESEERIVIKKPQVAIKK